MTPTGRDAGEPAEGDADEPAGEATEGDADEPAGEATEGDADEPAGWTVYVLVSARVRRTYVGITVDVDRRLAQHNGDLPGGAKATRAGRPWTVGARHGPYATRGEALRVERAIKQLRGRRRLGWAG